MLDPRDLNLGPDGLPSLMPSDLGRCEWCGDEATSVNERGEAVCRAHADKEQCAAGAERDYQLRDTPVPFEF